MQINASGYKTKYKELKSPANNLLTCIQHNTCFHFVSHPRFLAIKCDRIIFETLSNNKRKSCIYFTTLLLLGTKDVVKYTCATKLILLNIAMLSKLIIIKPEGHRLSTWLFQIHSILIATKDNFVHTCAHFVRLSNHKIIKRFTS